MQHRQLKSTNVLLSKIFVIMLTFTITTKGGLLILAGKHPSVCLGCVPVVDGINSSLLKPVGKKSKVGAAAHRGSVQASCPVFDLPHSQKNL